MSAPDAGRADGAAAGLHRPVGRRGSPRAEQEAPAAEHDPAARPTLEQAARLREWVALSGTRLDRDRPTRQTIWPGEQVNPPVPETAIVNRDEDFVAFVNADVKRRVRYACGSDTTRRMANQAFFTRIYLDADDTIRAEPTRSFGLLLDPDTQQQALSWADPQRQAGKRPTPNPSSTMSRVRVGRVEWS